MKRFDITLRSTGPGMLQNKMGMDQLLGLRDKTAKKAKTQTRPSLDDEARSHIHLNGDDEPCIPGYMLMASLIAAGVYIRLDQKRQLSTKDSTMLPGLLLLE